MTVYILHREVDVVGVYLSRARAESDAIKWDLFNWFITEHKVTK
jgi:hypothetical protein